MLAGSMVVLFSALQQGNSPALILGEMSGQTGTMIATIIGSILAIAMLALALGERSEGLSDVPELAEYQRKRLPDTRLTDADGRELDLGEHALAGPLLLVFVSPTCRACGTVATLTPSWRRLVPAVRIVHITRAFAPETVVPDYLRLALHDHGGELSTALGLAATPAAVVVGTDGLLAAGPVYGADEIGALLWDVAVRIESLRG